MKVLEVQIKNPVAVLDEIKDLMDMHCGVSETIAFEKEYPEVYQIYLTLRRQLGMVEPEQHVVS